jgi:phosphoribosylglycinamide formyltransferase-1
MSAAPRDPGPGTPALRVAVLASGRGSNFLALHEAASQDHLPVELVGVFSDKPGAAVLERARERGIPALALSPKDYPDRLHFDLALLNAVAAVQPDLIVCAGYMRILDGRALESFVGRMINIHPSLLPKYRGLHTHRRALEAGDAEHGASVHLVTAELDGGPVIAQAVVPVLPGDDETRLTERVLRREHPLLVACVDAFANGSLRWQDGALWHRGVPLSMPLRLGSDDRLKSPP